MKRVLVLGGYGAFGGRICELLSRDRRFEVLVAGRSLERAMAFCASRPELRLVPARADRNSGLTEAVAALRPWLVIDAAGPFQGASYDVARRCIEAACNYLDIADAREFVEGFGELDAAARTAGVTLVSGASSVPALSGAVVDALTAGLGEVGLVESAITASNRATVGRSVIEAILSYVGQPVPLRHAGRTVEARGWRGLRRQTFAICGGPELKGRLVAICDVPDLGLLSDRLPGRPLVVFRAGAELAAQNFTLWLLSWPVQWGWIRTLRPFAQLVQGLNDLTRMIGGERSAMSVTLVGLCAGEVVERRWTLMAEAGKGPYTPCLAAPLLAVRVADGALATGAATAVGLLSLDAFRADFDRLGFRTEIREVRRKPLYRQVMGAGFDRLPPAVRRIHEVAGAARAEGRARVTRGAHPLARLIGWIMRFPRAADDTPVTVRFFETAGRETWTRHFGRSGFTSHMTRQGDLLVERFGLMRFGFQLGREANGLAMHLRRWWIGPLAMPLALAPRSVARESEVDSVFHFEVAIDLPLIGHIVGYRGWLQRS